MERINSHSPKVREHAAQVEPLSQVDSGAQAQIDWSAAGKFLRRRIQAKLSDISSADIDDIVQDALIRALRASRRERVRNIEALMNVIADRTCADFLRSRMRWRAIMGSWSAAGSKMRDRVPSAEPFGDPIERAAFMVLEYFRTRNAPCYDLATLYFGRQIKWSEIARKMGKSPGAIRQQWYRCVEALRNEAKRLGDLLPF